MSAKNAGLLSRLADLEREAQQLTRLVGQNGNAAELLLARLLVDVDKVSARLVKHRQALEAASSKPPA